MGKDVLIYYKISIKLHGKIKIENEEDFYFQTSAKLKLKVDLKRDKSIN